MVEQQQTNGLSRDHKICCLNKVVLGCYDCCGCITKMYQQHSTVTWWNFEIDKQCLGPFFGFGT